MTDSMIFWAIACFFYGVQSVLKFRYDVSVFAAWGDRFYRWSNPDLSYQRKYQYPTTAPKNLYYRIFRLKYKEKFPLSATLLAPVTDAFHMAQLLTGIALVGAILGFNYEIQSAWEYLWIALTYKVSWSAFHEFCFSWLLIRRARSR